MRWRRRLRSSTRLVAPSPILRPVTSLLSTQSERAGLVLAGVAIGWALSRADWGALIAVGCAAIAGALLAAVLLSSYVVVQLGRAQAPPAPGSHP